MNIYNEKQLKQIELGKEKGVDTSIYENPEFNERQMEEIRLGLEAKIDASIYASPKLSGFEMMKKKYAMLRNIDPNKPLEGQIKYGYKACYEDMVCRGYQFKEGGTFELGFSPVMGKRGFHFCLDMVNCFSFYSMGSCKVYKVEILGEIDGVGRYTICCTNKIKFLEKVYDGEHSEN